MRNDRRLILVLVLLMAALVVSACSSDNQSGSGVVRLEDTQPAEPVIVSAGPSNPQADTPVPLVSETNATEQADPEQTDEELRVDSNDPDKGAYTKQEFLDHYSNA